jgi:transcriptional regulator with XRE-family HTH domain
MRLMSADQRQAMAERVAELMDAQGLTNEALAFRAGVATKTISRVLNARHESRAGTIEKLAKALGVDESELRGSPVYTRRTTGGETPDMMSLLAQIDNRLERIEGNWNGLLKLVEDEIADMIAVRLEQLMQRAAELEGQRQLPPPPRRRRASSDS